MINNPNYTNSKLIPLYPSFTKRTIIEKQSVLWRHIKYLSQPERLVADYSIVTSQMSSEDNPQQPLQIPVNSHVLMSAKSPQPFIPAVNSSEGFSAGVHEFPFLLRLPAHIPPTTNLSHAKIDYVLSANLRRKGLSSDLFAECDVVLLSTSMTAGVLQSPMYCQPVNSIESVLLDAESTLRATIIRPPYVFAAGDNNEARKRFMQITLKLDILMPQLVSEIKKVQRKEVTCFVRQWIRYGDSTTLASDIEYRKTRTRSIDRKDVRRQSIKDNLKEVRIPYVVDCVDSSILGEPVEYFYDKPIVDYSESPVQYNVANQILRSVTKPTSPSLRPKIPSNRSLRSDSNPDQFDGYFEDANADSRRSRTTSFSSSNFTSSFTLPSVTKIPWGSGIQQSYPSIMLEIPLDSAVADVHETELDIVHVLRIRAEIRTNRLLASSNSGSIYEGNSPSKVNFMHSITGRQRGLSGSSVITNNSEDDENHKVVDFELKIPVLSFCKQFASSYPELHTPPSPKSANNGFFNKSIWFGPRHGTMTPKSDSFPESSSIEPGASSDQQNFISEHADSFQRISQRPRTFSMPFGYSMTEMPQKPNRSRAKTFESQRGDSPYVVTNSDAGRERKSINGLPGNVVFVNKDQLKLQRKSKSSLLEFEPHPKMDPTRLQSTSSSQKTINSQANTFPEINNKSIPQIDTTDTLQDSLEDINFSQLTFDELNTLVGRLVNPSKPSKNLIKKPKAVRSSKSSPSVGRSTSNEESNCVNRIDLNLVNRWNIDIVKEQDPAQSSYVMPLQDDIIRAPLSGVVVVPVSPSNDDQWKLEEDVYILED
ncbi:hypothetical protein HK096_009716 [Nowakowskiella sp. JEL0078]|nr:hypothetical protein HK096_009716 [Nowakowskiella sp. JEL0078]